MLLRVFYPLFYKFFYCFVVVFFFIYKRFIFNQLAFYTCNIFAEGSTLLADIVDFYLLKSCVVEKAVDKWGCVFVRTYLLLFIYN